MKTGIKFLVVIVLIVTSIVLLLDMGVRADRWTGWLVLVMLPAAGYIIGKTNFQSSD